MWSRRRERKSVNNPSPEPYNPFLAASSASHPADPQPVDNDTPTAPLPLVAGPSDNAVVDPVADGSGVELSQLTDTTGPPRLRDAQDAQAANGIPQQQADVEWVSTGIPEPLLIPAWGAAPAPVPSGGYRLAPIPLATRRQSPKVQVAPARARSGVSRLLMTVRPKDRRPEALGVVRRPWVGRKRVVVGSLFGGAGMTSTVVALHGAARVLGVQSAVLDASSGWWPGASGWVDKTDAVATSWPEVLQTSPDERVSRFHAAVGGDEVGRGGSGWAKSLVIGDGMETWADHQRPTAVEASQIAAETSQAWPLTILEIGGYRAITAAVASARPQLLVMSCRASVDQLQATLDYLRRLTAEENFDTQYCAVIAIHQQRTGELAAELRPLRAQVVDAAAGLVTIGWIAGGRPAPISPQRVSDQGLMLLAAAALAIDNDTDTAGMSQYGSANHLNPTRPTP